MPYGTQTKKINKYMIYNVVRPSFRDDDVCGQNNTRMMMMEMIDNEKTLDVEGGVVAFLVFF